MEREAGKSPILQIYNTDLTLAISLRYIKVLPILFDILYSILLSIVAKRHLNNFVTFSW